MTGPIVPREDKPAAPAPSIAESGRRFAEQAATALEPGDHVAVSVGADDSGVGASVVAKLGEHVALVGEVEKKRGERRPAVKAGGVVKW